MGGSTSKSKRDDSASGTDDIKVNGNAPQVAPDHPLHHGFAVTNKHTGMDGFLEFSWPNIDFSGPHGSLIQRWPITCLRGFGQPGNEFSFETGRLCPTGVGLHFFVVKGGANLEAELQKVIDLHHGDTTDVDTAATEYSTLDASRVFAAPVETSTAPYAALSK
eukprot:m.118559 g.118559  ORF g.118559 m.118559 type:complete len:163 (-) comp17213_c0_seq1:263-751(-)